MTDFENRLKRLLNENVDARLGPRRPAPRLDLPATGPRGFRPWLIPLLATAGIAAATAAIVVPVRMVAGGSGLRGGGSNAGNLAGPVLGPTTPIPATSLGPSGRSAATRSTAPAGPTVRLGGATLRLPSGWVARDYSQYEPPGVVPLDAQAWCLTPASKPAGTAPHSCPVRFGTIAAKAAANPIDVNVPGGYLSDPKYCGRGLALGFAERSADVSFGGRAADFRRIEYGCGDGTHSRIEQYVVPTEPGYILVSEVVDDSLSAVLGQLVAAAQLPAQTGAVRYYDQGLVRRVVASGDGSIVSIDRTVPGPGGQVNNNPQTYDYFVPPAAKPDRLHLGEFISVFTDGSRVTQYVVN